MRNVLLITSAHEKYYHESFVQHCTARGIRVYVFDAERFPTEAQLNIQMQSGPILSGYIDVQEHVDDALINYRLSIGEIDVAWYLRPGKAVPMNAQSELEARFTKNESEATLDSFFSVLSCKWVNRKKSVQIVEGNKLYQQLVAEQSGLRTPQTLLTNSHADLIRFGDNSKDNRLIFKTVTFTELDKEANLFIYSEIISLQEIGTMEKAIESCPVFSQHYVEKLYEYRVMVIGSEILACQIDSQASEMTKIDWRHYDFENVEHKLVVLPQEVQDGIRCFMKNIDLSYGAIDMIQTPNNEFVFLEINPSGQWEWLSHYAKLPVAESVAKMLAQI